MKRSKTKRPGIESLNERYGWIFISPWVFGIAVFFIYPILHSVYLSFGALDIGENGVITSFKGLENYKELLLESPKYLDNLLAALSKMLVSLPFILIVSIALALLLEGEYKGRSFFRGFYFLPVIMASGQILSLFLKVASYNATNTAVAAEATFGMIDMNDILVGMHLPSFIEGYLSKALSNIFMLVWQSGIQTVLILAGLQTIPASLYEVSRVEGATKWEEFWFITLPMLLRTLILVILFTIIELVSSSDNQIVSNAYDQINDMRYGIGTAMLWFYFAAVILLVSVIYFVYNKLILPKWGDGSAA